MGAPDITIGAIDRLAVRRGIGREAVEHLLTTRAGLSPLDARQLAAHWFSAQYRHGGIAFRRAEYLSAQSQGSAAAGPHSSSPSTGL